MRINRGAVKRSERLTKLTRATAQYRHHYNRLAAAGHTQFGGHVRYSGKWYCVCIAICEVGHTFVISRNYNMRLFGPYANPFG